MNYTDEFDGHLYDYESVCARAEGLVFGSRGTAYGHPRTDYERTAQIWSAILGHTVTAEQAILCMIAVKLSRLCNSYQEDSCVDICGYAECYNRVVRSREMGDARPLDDDDD